MNRHFVQAALRDALVVAGIATIIATLLGDGQLGLGVVCGALIGAVDLWAIHVLVRLLIRSARRVGLMSASQEQRGGEVVTAGAERAGDGLPPPSHGGAGAGTALAVLGLVTKLGVLLFLIYAASAYLGASLVGIALGFGVVLTVVIVDAIRLGVAAESHA